MDKFTAFVQTYGIACGGNWSATLLSAIRQGLPEVYKQLKDDKDYSFCELVEVIKDNLK